jgi:uncharacterized membrane protein
MTEVSASVEIARSADDVFAYIADMANNPTWQKGQQRCVWTSEPPLKMGSTYDQTARFLGKTIVSSFEVIEYEPVRRIRITSTGGTMRIDVTREVAPNGPGRCTVSATVRGDPPGLMRLLGPAVDRIVRTSVRKDYEQLKQLLER